jgi:hypothetical protein
MDLGNSLHVDLHKDTTDSALIPDFPTNSRRANMIDEAPWPDTGDRSAGFPNCPLIYEMTLQPTKNPRQATKLGGKDSRNKAKLLTSELFRLTSNLPKTAINEPRSLRKPTPLLLIHLLIAYRRASLRSLVNWPDWISCSPFRAIS